ncbi:hypothetical protein D6779_10755 [Candidatus Parcubacteria bacterium]|nr:MAG: hypothetical protein D6779_10755 [Candidatus Parcubacteria bacterium]
MLRLFLLLAGILVLTGLFLAWVFGRRGAALVFILLGGVGLLVILGEMLHFSLAWILVIAYTLFVVVVGLPMSGNREAWQTTLAILAIIGFGGVGILIPALGYPDKWVLIGDGLILLVVVVVGAVMGLQGKG